MSSPERYLWDERARNLREEIVFHLMETRGRWRAFNLDWDDGSLEYCTDWGGGQTGISSGGKHEDLLLLEEVEYNASGMFFVPWTTVPRLKKLALHHGLPDEFEYYPLKGNWPNLVELALGSWDGIEYKDVCVYGVGSGEVLFMLERCPRLRALKCRMKSPGSFQGGSTLEMPISLHFLESIHIVNPSSASTFASSLKLPSLRKLVLEAGRRSPMEDIAASMDEGSALAWANHHGSGITQLTLGNVVITPAALCMVLEACPRLTTLAIEARYHTVDRTVVARLTPNDERKYLCPDLQDIRVVIDEEGRSVDEEGEEWDQSLGGSVDGVLPIPVDAVLSLFRRRNTEVRLNAFIWGMSQWGLSGMISIDDIWEELEEEGLSIVYSSDKVGPSGEVIRFRQLQMLPNDAFYQ